MRSGWEPSKKIDVSDILEKMRNDGFSPPHHLAKFFTHFYGVKVGGGDSFVIDYAGYPAESFRSIEAEIELKVYPIGGVCYCEYGLIADEEGCVYITDGKGPHKIGSNYAEGLEFLCSSSFKSLKLSPT